MTKLTSLRRVVICLGAPLALLACDAGPTETAAQLPVTISADRDRLSLTEPATLTVTVTNRGRGSISVNDPRNLCSPSYRVFDGANREVQLPDRICTAQGFPPRTLRVGESIVVTDRWAGTARGDDRTSIPVAPGSYRLLARITRIQQEYTSAPINVTVQ
jgi:hypothetical protein